MMYECGCGKKIAKSSLSSHLKTKAHKRWSDANTTTTQKEDATPRHHYYIAKRTRPRHFETTTGKSKHQEYLQIEGVPAKIISSQDGVYVLNSLTSSHNRNFAVTAEELRNEFEQAVIQNEEIVNCTRYPCNLPLDEFTYRDRFELTIIDIKNKFIKKIKSRRLHNFIKDKIFQMIQSQGCVKSITLTQYHEYEGGKLKLTKHKRIGDPIFNRNSRWCPPIPDNYTHEEFQASPSFPAPIGIRSKDFCLPSQLISSVKELLTQAIRFKNVDVIYRQILQNVLPEIRCARGNHKCKYCGVAIDITLYDSRYKSKENYIELCHRDPHYNYSPHNVYWGHGECNRKQGGYDEWTRINDAFVTLRHNWNDYTSEQHKHAMTECSLLGNTE